MIVVFADIQGNPWALGALLERARRLGAREVVLLGNAVGGGPRPQETVELLRRRHVALMRGPRDAAALGRAPAPALADEGARNAQALQPADLAYLRQAAPPLRRLTLAGRRILLSTDPGQPPEPHVTLLRPSTRTHATDALVTLSPAGAPDGEAPFAAVGDDGTVAVDHAAWDVDAYRRATSTRHV